MIQLGIIIGRDRTPAPALRIIDDKLWLAVQAVNRQAEAKACGRRMAMDEFVARVGPVLKDWRGHLRKNTHVAQQVLRKVLPARLTVTLLPDGGWEFEGLCDYRKVLAELGLDAVMAVVGELAPAKSSAPSARSIHFGRPIVGLIA